MGDVVGFLQIYSILTLSGAKWGKFLRRCRNLPFLSKSERKGGEIDVALQDSYFEGAAAAKILYFCSFAAVEVGSGRRKQPNITA